MKRPPLITLFDMSADIAASENILFGAGAPALVDCAEAINWIATGGFGDPIGPKPWTECSDDTLDSMFERAAGRHELAEEIIISGISTGRLRCVYVGKDTKTIPTLAHVDPAIFEGMEITYEWDESLEIQVFPPDNEDDYIGFSKFWFFWDEIAALTPRRVKDLAEPLLPAPTPSPIAGTPRFQAVGQIGKQDGLPPAHSSEAHGRRGRGRPAGKNGEPIAMFVLRVQAEGVEDLDGLSDDALGAMLKEEYLRLGLNVPEITNAARDARGVLRALVKMQAKIDAEAAE